jgi:hypothetical protein
MCSKCGDVWHVIVAMVGDRIAKVQCKECGSLHRHRPPGGVAAKGKTTRTRKSAAVKVKAVQGPTVEPDLRKPTRAYIATDQYAVAERVQHPSFGIGVVESTQAGKVTVYFPVGRKVLAQGSGTLRLERPPRWTHDEAE